MYKIPRKFDLGWISPLKGDRTLRSAHRPYIIKLVLIIIPFYTTFDNCCEILFFPYFQDIQTIFFVLRNPIFSLFSGYLDYFFPISSQKQEKNRTIFFLFSYFFPILFFSDYFFPILFFQTENRKKIVLFFSYFIFFSDYFFPIFEYETIFFLFYFFRLFFSYFLLEIGK